MSIAFVDINTLRPEAKTWTPKNGGTRYQGLGYLRVSSINSKGVEVGNPKSNAEQLRNITRSLDAIGADLAHVVDEGAKSGSRNRAKRVGFDEVKKQIATGRYDVFAVWSSSRSARDVEVVFNELLPVMRRTNTRYHYGRRVYDPNDAQDRADIISDAQRDEAYSQRLGADVKRAAMDRAEHGAPHSALLLGYRRVWTIGPEGRELGQTPYDDNGDLLPAAVAVQNVFAGLLAGKSAKVLQRELADVGIVRTTVAIRLMLANPGYAGLRRYRGHIVGNAAWPGIVPLADYEKVQAILATRTAAGSRGNVRRHLLSGVCVCGVCGATMYATVKKSGRLYRCNGSHTVINADQADDVVVGALLTNLADKLEAIDPVATPEAVELDTLIAEHQRNLDTWKSLVVAGKVDPVSAGEWSAEARGEIAKLVAKREAANAARMSVPSIAYDIANAPDPLAAWESFNDRVEQQTEIIRALVTITINRGTGGRYGFDPGRIQIDPVTL